LSRRRRARKIILDALYRMEIDSCDPLEALYDYEEEMASKEIGDFIERVVYGVTEKKVELDHIIDSYADKWTANRMPILDRNILRIGIFEMKFEDDIPTSVTINEAVEMANTYSTDESGRFINGILGKLAKDGETHERQG
jgi:transcription antitermination protein NusB